MVLFPVRIRGRKVSTLIFEADLSFYLWSSVCGNRADTIQKSINNRGISKINSVLRHVRFLKDLLCD